MKSVLSTLTLTTVLACSTLTGNARAHTNETEVAKPLRFIGDVRYAGFCKAVIEDNVTSIKRHARLNVGEVAPSRQEVLRAVSADNGVTCNGKTLIEFSLEKNATEVYSFLVAQR
ncbi:DUF3718 domain-containing protein [Alteromonas facilis]|uniref:DUF3718 domain-containing protein n=1 Tax=Alteromonas facilis TaxID=2048004 RepID=UPI000C2858A6|nr:DUF3718 domain-containing protein [Alteromonas facilis]